MKSAQAKAKKMSEIMKKHWEDPDYRETVIESSRKRLMEIWYDPHKKQEMIKKIKTAKNTPEAKKKVSESMREVAKNPEFGIKVGNIMREKYNTPKYRELFHDVYEGHREEHQQQMKDKWQDPEYVYKVMKSRFNHKTALNTLEKRFGYEVRQEFETRE